MAAPLFDWDIVREGFDSIGHTVLPGAIATRGVKAGRTGVVPAAGVLTFTVDELRVRVGDKVELQDRGVTKWTGHVRQTNQTFDRTTNEARWNVTAYGTLSRVINARAGPIVAIQNSITLRAAIDLLLDAVNIPIDMRDIQASSIEISTWQLPATQRPWAELLKLMRTAGPRARFYEDALGKIVFRETVLSTVSRTLYGRNSGSGDRPIVSRIENESDGLDRVANTVTVPYEDGTGEASGSRESSIVAFGQQGTDYKVADGLSQAQAESLVERILEAGVRPRASWDTILDAGRDAETQAAALAIEIGERAAVTIDAQFDRIGEVLSVKIAAHSPAVMRATITMLDSTLEAAFLDLESGDSLLLEDDGRVFLYAFEQPNRILLADGFTLFEMEHGDILVEEG